jgi:hypothetical protein
MREGVDLMLKIGMYLKGIVAASDVYGGASRAVVSDHRAGE